MASTNMKQKIQQGVLDVLRTSKDKDELKSAIQTYNDTYGQEGPAASEADILSEDESISFDEKRRKRAPKRVEVEPANVASISDTGDLRADYLNLPEPTIEDPRSMSDRERRMAQVAAAAEGARYREALQGRGTSAFQRSIDLDEIRGEKDPETGLREVALGEDAAEYGKQYARLALKNPDMSKMDLQDAAIRAVREEQAKDAAFQASKFGAVDYGDEMENEARRQRLAAEATEADAKPGDVLDVPRSTRNARERGAFKIDSSRRDKDDTTAQQRAARIAMQASAAAVLGAGAAGRDKVSRSVPEIDTVDYTTATEESADAVDDTTTVDETGLPVIPMAPESESEKLLQEAEAFQEDIAIQQSELDREDKRIKKLFEQRLILEEANEIRDNLEKIKEFQRQKFERSKKRIDPDAMREAARQLKNAEDRIKNLNKQISEAQTFIASEDPRGEVNFSRSEMLSKRLQPSTIRKFLRRAAMKFSPTSTSAENVVATTNGAEIDNDFIADGGQ